MGVDPGPREFGPVAEHSDHQGANVGRGANELGVLGGAMTDGWTKGGQGGGAGLCPEETRLLSKGTVSDGRDQERTAAHISIDRCV